MSKQTALQAFDSTLHFGRNIIFFGNNGRLGSSYTTWWFYILPLAPHPCSNHRQSATFLDCMMVRTKFK